MIKSEIYYSIYRIALFCSILMVLLSILFYGIYNSLVL